MGPLRITFAGRTVDADGTRPLIAGRDAATDLPCADQRVSRQHVRILRTPQGWVVEDLQSRNGVWLNGRRIARGLSITQPVQLRLGHPTEGPVLALEPQPETATPAPAEPVSAAPEPEQPQAASTPAEPVRAPEASPEPVRAAEQPPLHAEDRVAAPVQPRPQEPVTPQPHPQQPVPPVHPQPQHADTPAQPRMQPPVAPAPPRPPQPVAAATPRPPAPQPVAPVHAAQPARSGDLGTLTVVHDATTARLRIGRAGDNDIVIPDLLVSRHHAEVSGDPRIGLQLRDLGSHNGTYVNGRRIGTAMLGEGDLVTVGSHHLRLVNGRFEEWVEESAPSFDVVDLQVVTPEGRMLLDHVSFALEPSSLLAVVGTSGAGKSTLLNALTGFRPADAGAVLYGGRDMYAAYEELRRRIGYVPQDDIIHTQLTVRQALGYAAELRFPPDVPEPDRDRRVGEVMGELGLSERADLVIERLSGGQRKRSSIAVELLTRPSVLFLDEPTSGLDPGYEKAVMQLLRELADGGRTVIVVTHSVQSLHLCDRVLFMAPGGRAAFFGPSNEALEYFRREDFADVFTDLEHRRDVDWGRAFADTAAYDKYVRSRLSARHPATAAPPPQASQVQDSQLSWGRQFWTLTRRYLAVMASDRRNLALLLLQAPVIALLMLAAMPANDFDVTPGASHGTSTPIMMLVIGMTLVGMLNAAREIVKEYPVYRRERSVGLSITAYVASKLAVLVPLTVVQALVLVLIGTARQGGPTSASALGNGMFELCVDVALTGVAALTLGLMMSALVKSADKAITALVMVVVAQLILSNPQIDVSSKPVLGQVAWVTSAKWGFDAVASTVRSKTIDRGLGANRPWGHDPGTWLLDAGVLVLLIVVQVAVTWYLLKRRDPALLGHTAPRAAPAAGPPQQQQPAWR